MKGSTKKGLKAIGVLTLTLAISSLNVQAQEANFGSVALAPGFPRTEGVMSGYTGGSYSLSAIANSDRDNRRCVGFGDPTPDHILILEQDFPQLTIQVNSRGHDTTLLVQGPDNQTIRCGDDTGSSKDASVTGTNWSAGTYRIWVGSFQSGSRQNYNLSVRQ